MWDSLGSFSQDVSWADAVVGFALGVGGGWLLGIPGRRRARREHAQSVRAEWLAAATVIEAKIFEPGTTAPDLAHLRDTYPLDLWRMTLGAEHFKNLEGVVNAMAGRDYFASEAADRPNDAAAADGLARAIMTYEAAVTRFVNAERFARSEQYGVVLHRERRSGRPRQLARHWRR